MCGIAGIIDVVNKPSLQQLKDAVACLAHRGPQKEATWADESGAVVLGHRRLSIIDLSEAASQPLHYRNRYTIVYNGEIYNYLELKEKLAKLDYGFSSASDTEVILAAYDAWGEACLQQFDGMFAFAIWDAATQRLFAARDRFGEKPFYYSYENGRLCFASEIKALKQLSGKTNVNKAMLYNFLTLSYTGNPRDSGETFYEAILQLPAGYCLRFDLRESEPEIEQFHQFQTGDNISINDNDAIEQFRNLLYDSIRKRLRSDVPIGTSLSGGLDSSAIVALCNQLPSGNYSHQCFTASFEGFEKDETKYAAELAAKFGLKHHLATIASNEIVPLMIEVMQHQDEPISSASPLAQFAVYRRAKQEGVTVLLDGQGADEILAGYTKYFQWYWRELYASDKSRLNKELAAAKALQLPATFNWKQKAAARFPQLAGGLLETIQEKRAYRNSDLQRSFAFLNKRSLYYTLPSQMDLNGILYFNSILTGLPELLRLADRNSMAHSIEVRLPFLGPELAQFVFSLPAHFKIREGRTKWLLRQAVKDLLPPSIVWRTDKIGFEPPQQAWMQQKDVQQAIHEGKEKLVSNDILHPSVLNKNRPHTAYAAGANDWKYWSASFLFND